jgi:hypothetical protein
MLSNWIEGRNPFKLPEPSAWWLQLLRDYDPQLVLIPSVKDCTYRLTQRVRPEAKRGLDQMKILDTHPDTAQLCRYGLVPVATVHTWAVKSDKIIRDLMARDYRRHGGGAKVLATTEYEEQRAEQKLDAQQSETLGHVNADAYRSLKFQKGESVSMLVNPNTKPVAPTGYKSVSSRRPTGLRPGADSFAPKVTLVTAPG